MLQAEKIKSNWEQFLWYSIHNDIRNYPDGFEIGVSALEAGMKWNYNGVFNHFLMPFAKEWEQRNQKSRKKVLLYGRLLQSMI